MNNVKMGYIIKMEPNDASHASCCTNIRDTSIHKITLLDSVFRFVIPIKGSTNIKIFPDHNSAMDALLKMAKILKKPLYIGKCFYKIHRSGKKSFIKYTKPDKFDFLAELN